VGHSSGWHRAAVGTIGAVTAPLDFVAIAAEEAARCASLARVVPHDVPLAQLPGWTVGDVMAHLAGDFVWASSIISARAWDGRPLASVGEQGDELMRRFEQSATEMVAALAAAAAEPDVACPNFAQGTRGRLGWWPRHQAHETTLHRWDLEVPTGAHVPIGAAQAADGLEELFATYTRRYAGFEFDAPVTMRCTDQPAAWRVTPVRGGRVEVEECGGLPEADVEGPAESLLLVAWARLQPDEAGLIIRARAPEFAAFLAGPVTA